MAHTKTSNRRVAAERHERRQARIAKQNEAALADIALRKLMRELNGGR